MEGPDTNTSAPRASERSLLPLLAIIALALMLLWNFLPLLAGSEKSKIISIVGNLQQIKLAKELWASDHPATGSVEVSVQDLTPYLGPLFVSNNLAKLKLGVLYSINPLGTDPEAKLTRKLDKFPAGTTVTLYPVGNPRSHVVLPGQAVQPVHASRPPQETNRTSLPSGAGR